MKIFVGNLPFAFDDQRLERLFITYGTIAEASVAREDGTNRSRGFGYVTFVDAKAAEEAIRRANGLTVEGRTLTVAAATDRPRSGYRTPKKDWSQLGDVPVVRRPIFGR